MIWIYILGGLVVVGLLGLVISILKNPAREVRKIARKTFKKGMGLGDWIHGDTVADRMLKNVIKPQDGELHSYAFIKMSEGPWRLRMDACDSHFRFTFLKENKDVLGHLSNSDCAEGEDIDTMICLPATRQKGKKVKEKILRAKTCWIIARFSVESKDDIERINSIQRSLTLERD